MLKWSEYSTVFFMVHMYGILLYDSFYLKCTRKKQQIKDLTNYWQLETYIDFTWTLDYSPVYQMKIFSHDPSCLIQQFEPFWFQKEKRWVYYTCSVQIVSVSGNLRRCRLWELWSKKVPRRADLRVHSGVAHIRLLPRRLEFASLLMPRVVSWTSPKHNQMSLTSPERCMTEHYNVTTWTRTCWYFYMEYRLWLNPHPPLFLPSATRKHCLSIIAVFLNN